MRLVQEFRVPRLPRDIREWVGWELNDGLSDSVEKEGPILGCYPMLD